MCVCVWVIRKINGDIQLQQSAATASGTCGLIISAQIKNKATLQILSIIIKSAYTVVYSQHGHSLQVKKLVGLKKKQQKKNIPTVDYLV